MSLFGGPDLNDFTNALIEGLNQYGKPKSPQFPSGNFNFPGGGGISFGPQQTASFQNNPGLLSKIQAGTRGKHLSPEALAAIKANPNSFDATLLNPFIKNKLKLKGGLGKKTFGFNVQPTPASSEYFDFLQNQATETAKKNAAFQNQFIAPLLTNLANFQSKSLGAASNIIPNLTENSPYIQQQNEAAKQAFFNSGSANLNRAYKQNLASINEMLANIGQPLGRSSDAGIFINQQLNQPLAEQLKDLALQSEIYGRDLANQGLANSRAAFGALGTAPGFNAGAQGLQLQNLNFNPAFSNPAGQFDLNSLLSQMNFGNTFGQTTDQIKLSPFTSSLPSMFTGATAPSGISNLFNSFGSFLPFAFLNR